MCGILAIVNQEYDNTTILDVYDGLTSIQHRGQDGFGICCDDRAIRRNGLVSMNIQDFNIFDKSKNSFIGHVRYRTNGEIDDRNIQPIVYEDKIRISLIHNGNIINTEQLQTTREYQEFISGNHNIGSSDSCIITAIFLRKLQSYENHISNEKYISNVIECCKYLYEILIGSYAICINIENFGTIVLRDKYGIRPLIYGIKDNSYIISSESSVLQHLNYKIIRDVKPGEVILFPTKINIYEPIFYEYGNTELKPCLFEYIYFARADSIIDKISVYDARYKMGQILGKTILKQLNNDVDKIDYIVPVPDTSSIFSLGVHNIIKKDIHYGFIKNNYIKRTFIMENHNIIKQNVKKKLHVVEEIFKNKNIIIIDDSIVRGNTSKHIINLAKKCNVNSIIFCSASPAVLNTNNYGIYIATCEELIAHNKTNEEIAEILGIDKIIYNDLQEITQCLKKINPDIKGFETSMFEE